MEDLFSIYDNGLVLPAEVTRKTVCDVLSFHFRSGYLLQSAIDQKRFREAYRNMTSVPLAVKDVDRLISACGIICDTRVFAPEAMLSGELRREIYNFISDFFASGWTYIYYDYLFRCFQKKLYNTEIIDASRLRSYLKYYFSRDWLFRGEYIATSEGVQVCVNEKVIAYIKECERVVKEGEVVKAMFFLPEADVQRAFHLNSDVLINDAKMSKFHIDHFVIAPSELDKICYIIDSTIDKYNIITKEELLTYIKDVLPKLIENNSDISEHGLFKALKTLLSSKYSFNKTIISRLGQKKVPEDVLTEYASQHKQFTLEDIGRVAEQLGALVNYQLKNIYRYAIRIDDDTFVSIEDVPFDIVAIDLALDKCFDGGYKYIPLKKVENFVSFPQMKYVWNQRLLESFLFTCCESRYGILYSDSIRSNSICGVIIRKEHCNGWTFDDVLIDALAQSGLLLESKDEALDYVVENGYIVKRKYKHFDDVVAKAQKK